MLIGSRVAWIGQVQATCRTPTRPLPNESEGLLQSFMCLRCRGEDQHIGRAVNIREMAIRDASNRHDGSPPTENNRTLIWASPGAALWGYQTLWHRLDGRVGFVGCGIG